MLKGQVGIGLFLRLGVTTRSGQVPFTPCHLPRSRESPLIWELGAFGMEPDSLNQHGTNSSASSSGSFGKASQDLMTLPHTCLALVVPQSHSCSLP